MMVAINTYFPTTSYAWTGSKFTRIEVIYIDRLVMHKTQLCFMHMLNKAMHALQSSFSFSLKF